MIIPMPPAAASGRCWSICLKSVLLLLLVVVGGLAVFGQEITGTIVGDVSDQSGGRIQNATVVVKQINTNITRQFTTSEEGSFVIPYLAVGQYDVSVAAPGFSALTKHNLELDVNQTLRVNFTLVPGSRHETLTVEGNTTEISTETGSQGVTVGQRLIEQLPNLTRNPVDVTFLSPNIAPSDYSRETYTATGSLSSINGGRFSDNEILLDGATLVDMDGYIGPNISQEFIQEARIETNASGAEFGHVLGGTISLTTKSGTNALHGSVFDYNRVRALMARNFFDTTKPSFTRNDTGYSLGGPVVLPGIYHGRNKTFFFSAYEAIIQANGVTSIGTVPTQAERAGNFAADPVIYDPLSTSVQNGIASRTTFPETSFRAPASILWL